MKTALKIIILFFSISFFSCPKANVEENLQLLGVWDHKENEGDEKRTFRLVFGKDNIGMQINRVEYVSGEISSSAIPFEWLRKNDTIEIEKKEIYLLKSEGELVSNESKDLVLVKVTDDYSQYFGNK